MAGRKGKCPKCGKPVQVPSLDRSEGADWPPSPDALAVPPPPSIHVTGASDSDTNGPEPGAEVTPEDYAFLRPAKGPGELGWLGSYRVLKVLGAGGMGIVFLAEDPQLQRHVALKVMRPTLASNSAARQRFLREARAAAAIEHDHIVGIFQVAEDRGVPFLAMPFLKGESLDARLNRDSSLPVPEVLRIGREIAEGLDAAHQHGLIHRDIKPGNIWLEDKGRAERRQPPGGSEAGGRVKILDFGMARTVDSKTLRPYFWLRSRSAPYNSAQRPSSIRLLRLDLQGIPNGRNMEQAGGDDKTARNCQITGTDLVSPESLRWPAVVSQGFFPRPCAVPPPHPRDLQTPTTRCALPQ